MKVIWLVGSVQDLELDEVCECGEKECETKQDKKSSFESYNMGYELGYEHGFKEAELQNKERLEGDVFMILANISKMKDRKFKKVEVLDAIYKEVQKLTV